MQDRDVIYFFNNLPMLKAILRIDYVDDFLACIVNRLQIPILGYCCAADGWIVCTPTKPLDDPNYIMRAAEIRFHLTSTIVLFPFFCRNKGFIQTFIGFRPYLRDLLRMQKSSLRSFFNCTQSLDMTWQMAESGFLGNLPIFSCWKCYRISLW